MKLAWANAAWDDYTWWQENDRKTARKINDLIKSARQTPLKNQTRSVLNTLGSIVYTLEKQRPYENSSSILSIN
jgi:hypothetical protein